MHHWALGICVFVLAGCSLSVDVPIVFEKNTSVNNLTQANLSFAKLTNVPSLTFASDSEALKIPITGSDNVLENESSMTVGELKMLFDARVEPDNPMVHEKALLIAQSGNCTINQVRAIYSYLKNGDIATKKWNYVSDPRGINDYFYANQTLRLGKAEECSGVGDCDDFAILMSALIESIGGTTRIILASNNLTGGHSYTEVYLGQLYAPNNQVNDIIDWLMEKFETTKIYAHIDITTGDVWLNLDWSADHPGGPFFEGDRHLCLEIRTYYQKSYMHLPDIFNKTPIINSINPDKTNPFDSETRLTWIAKAYDPENDLILYRFYLNDDPVTKWITNNSWIWSPNDNNIGENKIEVLVRDGKHAGSDSFDDRRIVIFNISDSKAIRLKWDKNGHYYEIITKRLNWEEAKKYATDRIGIKDYKGHLATITSPEEKSWIVYNLILPSDFRYEGEAITFWLGGYQEYGYDSNPTGGWHWITGEPWSWTNWYPGEPNDTGGNESILQMLTNGEWNDNVVGGGLTTRFSLIEYEIAEGNRTPNSIELPELEKNFKNKILFDESHNQFWTACIDGGLADYANELRNIGYQVEVLKDGPITYDLLKNYRILAFPNGFVGKHNLSGDIKLLTKNEIDSIKNFVYDGGGLALFECGWSWVGYSGENIKSAPINQIGMVFGLALNDDMIHDPTNYYENHRDACPIFYKPFIKNHTITKDVSIISNCEGIPSSLAISNPNAEILITGDDDSYSGKYSTGQKPPFLAIANYGKGKVVIFGQTGIISSTDGNNDGIKDIYEYDNKKLALNVMRWLSSD